MTTEQYRAALADHHTSTIAAGIKAGHDLRTMNLYRQIEDYLISAADRRRMAAEAAEEGNTGMAAYHHQKSREYITSARRIIALPGGREAYALYQERTNV